MEEFCFQLENSRKFSVTTDRTVYESLYLLSVFNNWEDIYNLCFSSLLSIEQYAEVTNAVSKVDQTPYAWIPIFCSLVHVAIDKLAADLLCVKIDGMSRSAIQRAHQNNDASMQVSIQEISQNISLHFDAFCKMCKGEKARRDDLEGTVLTIDDIDAIDRKREQKKREEMAQTCLKRLIHKLNISDIAFWFMIYVIYQMEPAQSTAMMTTLHGWARSEAIFSEETFDALEQWKNMDAQLTAMGGLNADSMTFIFMFIRA